MRVLSIFGTRPEAIKMSPVVLQLNGDARFESILCVTGQHREMLDQVLNVFHLAPDFDLSIMEERQTLETITAKTLTRLSSVFSEVKPDIVLVHGDTTSSMASAIAAFYNKIPVGHVEAGLRTYERYSPFPEEMNRKIITAVATYHFAPTESNRNALARENVSSDVWVTGNTGLDSFKYTIDPSHIFSADKLNHLDYSKPTVLVTAHRRENLGMPLQNICKAIGIICKMNPTCQVVYPVHLNPAVREVVFSMLGENEQVVLLDPIDVLDMHNLMQRCFFVMTDSGGLQEEAPFLDKPVLVLRRDTERPEVIETGAALLVGTEVHDITQAACGLLEGGASYHSMASAACPYGDGHASERIADALGQIMLRC